MAFQRNCLCCLHQHVEVLCVLCYLGAVAERTAQEQAKVSSSYPSIMKKRGYEQSNGLDGKLFCEEFIFFSLLVCVLVCVWGG